MMKILILVLATLLPSAFSDQAWCGLPSCDGLEHVDCTMWDGSFSAACPDSAVMLNLQPAIDRIVAKHNVVRNQVAGGQLSGFFAARRMGTMQWDVTLANLARRNVKKCTFTADACRNTPDLDYVGQNIARARISNNANLTNIQVIESMIQAWINQYSQTTMADIRSFPQPTTGSPRIANFAQIVRDYATKVGCGALKYNSAGSTSTFLFTCNYDETVLVDWPVYTDGPNASKCQTGRNPTYPFLCSTSEVYNVNTFFNDTLT